MTTNNILSICHFLRDAACRMTFEQFAAAMKKAIDADEDYCRDVFFRFQDNPAAFLAHRTPQSQSECIIDAMLDLAPEHLPVSTASPAKLHLLRDELKSTEEALNTVIDERDSLAEKNAELIQQIAILENHIGEQNKALLLQAETIIRFGENSGEVD